VIDHLPELDVPMESQALNAFQVNLREQGQRPQVYVSLSALLRRVDGRVPQELNFYRAKLDGRWSIFGENRLLLWQRLAEQRPVGAAAQYFPSVFYRQRSNYCRKFFWRNSVAGI